MYCSNMCNVIKILFLSLRNPFKTRLNRSFCAGNCLNGRAEVFRLCLVRRQCTGGYQRGLRKSYISLLRELKELLIVEGNLLIKKQKQKQSFLAAKEGMTMIIVDTRIRAFSEKLLI